MNHGSLFSGIGGFDLAAQWMGWENKFHCEWNEFGQKVLKYYWPEAESFSDITKTNFSKYANQIDILTGGFPCQPYSTAGKRLGKDDERHLWPEMLRVIREVKPTWVVGENVRGLISWNGGMVFHEVQDDLENEGYEVQSFLIPAASVNAPHRRDRIWFVAYSDNKGGSTGSQQVQKEDGEISQRNNNAESCDTDGINVAYTNNKGLERCENYGGFTKNKQERRKKFAGCIRSNWKEFPTVSPLCDGDDGISDRLDSITFPKWRNESIKAGGNAIVPQVAFQIFKAIEMFENEN